MVEAKAGDDAAQIGFRHAHRVAVGIKPPEECLLDHILRVRDRSQHPVGDADQFWTQGIEGGNGVLVGHRSPQAAWRCSTGCTARKPTWIRFQPLIATISKVSITCSSSVKCARNDS